MARGWKKKTGPILNLELWKEAVEAVRGHQLDPQWVRGHEGHPQNEYANHLATRAARELSSSNGLVSSEFDEWFAAEREAGRMTVEPQSFPRSDRFRPVKPYPITSSPTVII
jgi:ribonuclease HI